MCKCQPGDLVEVVPTDEEKIKYYQKCAYNILIIEYYNQTKEIEQRRKPRKGNNMDEIKILMMDGVTHPGRNEDHHIQTEIGP